MRYFEIISVGGYNWCLIEKNDKAVCLCTEKSVFRSKMAAQDGKYNGNAVYEGSSIENYLNNKFVQKLCSHGIKSEHILAPITIFDADTIRKINNEGFRLPDTGEERLWLKTKTLGTEDQSVSNYILQVDNNGDFHKECGDMQAGVRAVMVIARDSLTENQNKVVIHADCLADKTTGESQNSLFGKDDPNKTYRRLHVSFKSSSHDKAYRLKYYVVFCPLPSVARNEVYMQEIKDIASNKAKICGINGAAIENIVFTDEYVYLTVNTDIGVNIDVVIADIKNRLKSKSMSEDRNFLAKFTHSYPARWYEGYLLDTVEIPVSVIKEYIETVINGDVK